MTYQVDPELQEFHTRYPDGVKWRLTERGVEIEGTGIERSVGAPTTATKVWTQYNEPLNLHAKKHGIPIELIVAAICTESSGQADSYREEPGYTSDDDTPNKVSCGLMHTLISTAKAMAAQLNVQTADVDRTWLYTPTNSINAGTAYIASQKNMTKLDPILVAAAYNHGSVAQSLTNRWCLKQWETPTPHCDRFLHFFNDFWAVLDTHPIRPSLSFWEYFHQTSCVFPVDIGTGTSLTETNIKRYYEHVEKKYEGGYFPLGANSVWHGGIHLRAPQGQPVVACADGEIIAARLGEEDKGAGHYGSFNFILMKHYVTGRLLNEAAAKAVGKKFIGFKVKAPILNLRPGAGTDQPPLGSLHNDDEVDIQEPTPKTTNGYTWMKVRVTKAKEPSMVGKEGWIAINDSLVERLYEEPPKLFDPEARKTYYSLYMHLNGELLDTKNERLRQVAWLQHERLTTATSLNLRAMPNGVVITTLSQGDKLDRVDETNTTVGGNSWIRVKVTEAKNVADKDKIGYVAFAPQFVTTVREPDQRVLDQFKSGEIVKLDQRAHAQDVLWTVGEYGSPGYRTGLIHWELFSEENLLPKFDTAEDDKDDFQIHAKHIFSMVKQNWFGSNDNLDEDELSSFYRDNPDAMKLRRYACKFISEWGVDLDRGIKNLKGRFFTRGLKERMRQYMWWNDAAAKGVPLPSSPRVWHYNPIAFMEMVGAFTVKPPGGAADNQYKLPVVPAADDAWAIREGKKVPFFSQLSDPWQGRILHVNKTIHAQGCAITSVTMCLRFYGRNIDPLVMDEYLDDNDGYEGENVKWQVAYDCEAASGGVKLTYADKVTDHTRFKQIIDTRLAQNMPTIVYVDYQSDSDHMGNHFVVIVGRLKNGQYVMNDPGSTEGDGAGNPNTENQINLTTRHQGYNVVALYPFTVS